MVTLVFLLLPLLISLPKQISSTPLNKCYPSQSYPQTCMCNSTYCDDAPPVHWCQDEWELHTYLTSEGGSRLNYSMTYFRIPGKNKDANFTVVINPCKKYQKIIGFGGAMTDSAAFMISCLSQGAKQNLISSYFDCETGIGYNMLRVPFGASDFSPMQYTYADASKPDLELNSFALNEMDTEYKIPLIKLAQVTSCNDIQLKAVSWKAPRWMTKSESTNTVKIFNSSMAPELVPSVLPHIPIMFQKFNRSCILPKYGKIYAKYLSRALKEYHAHGLNFTFISGGEEVQYAAMSDCWDKEAFKNWTTEDLCPTLQKDGFGQVKILALDDQTLFLPEWQKILEDKKTNSCIAGFATHWYLEFVPGISVPIQQDFCKKYPDQILINTESSACDYELDYVQTSDWEKARRYAIDIIDRLSTCNHGYIDWNLALNLQGGPNQYGINCHSAIVIDCEADKFYKRILFYVLGHFSKFVPEDSVSVDVKIEAGKTFQSKPLKPKKGRTLKLQPIKAVAFKVKHDYCSKDDLVVIALNQNTVDLKINICIGSEKCATILMPKNSIVSTVTAMPSFFSCKVKIQVPS